MVVYSDNINTITITISVTMTMTFFAIVIMINSIQLKGTIALSNNLTIIQKNICYCDSIYSFKKQYKITHKLTPLLSLSATFTSI